MRQTPVVIRPFKRPVSLLKITIEWYGELVAFRRSGETFSIPGLSIALSSSLMRVVWLIVKSMSDFGTLWMTIPYVFSRGLRPLIACCQSLSLRSLCLCSSSCTWILILPFFSLLMPLIERAAHWRTLVVSSGVLCFECLLVFVASSAYIQCYFDCSLFLI